jgi:acyl transferase domain-containing protein
MKFSTLLTGNEFFLKDHVIFDQKILPASAYLEMARAAAEIAGERPVSKLKNVFFAQPITLAGGPDPDVSILLNPNEDKINFEITSSGAVNAQGTAVFGDDENAESDFIDLQSILDRCNRSVDGQECYQLFDNRGIKYGESFRAIKQLSHSANEGIARLELPATLSHAFREFVLHPALLDAALQTIFSFRDDAETDTAYLPVAVGEVDVIGELPETCYAYIVKAGENRSALKSFNILIADDDGRVRLKIKDFAVKAFQSTAVDENSERNEPQDDAELLNILQEIERGTLKIDAAEMFLDKIYA